LEVFGYIVTVICLFLSNSGGLGGGGSMVPIIIFFFRFDLKRAIAISNSTICCSAIIRHLVNASKKHPLKIDEKGEPTGVLVDYNIGALMLPAITLGVTFGAILNTIMPELVILICLVVLLVGVVTMNGTKIFSMRKAETLALVAPKAAEMKEIGAKRDSSELDHDKIEQEKIVEPAASVI